MSTTDLKAKSQQFMEKVLSDPATAIKETAANNIVLSNSQPDNAPLKKSAEGHDGFAQYVEELKQHIDMGPIEYSDLYVEGKTVIGLGVEKSVVRSTGKSYEMPFVHIFRYDDADMLAELRVFNNTHRLSVAFD